MDAPNPGQHDLTDDGRAGFGTLVEGLLDEHWPDNQVNGWYLADLLRDKGARLVPPCGAIPEGVGGPIPCAIIGPHDEHLSTSGCAGSEIRWPNMTGSLILSCPRCGAQVTTSGGRHPSRCIRASCRYEGDGVVDGPASLMAFFKDHRPLPCSTNYPEEEGHWYTCTCKRWASTKTRFWSEPHHIQKFEAHMAEALLAMGWRLGGGA